jgi:hypothetical protein
MVSLHRDAKHPILIAISTSFDLLPECSSYDRGPSFRSYTNDFHCVLVMMSKMLFLDCNGR